MFKATSVLILLVCLCSCSKRTSSEGNRKDSASDSILLKKISVINLATYETKELKVDNFSDMIEKLLSIQMDDVPAHSPHPLLEWKLSFELENKENVVLYFLADGTLINMTGSQTSIMSLEKRFKSLLERGVLTSVERETGTPNVEL